MRYIKVNPNDYKAKSILNQVNFINAQVNNIQKQLDTMIYQK